MTERSRRRHQEAYRTLMLLYPRDLRIDHGAEMVQVFGDLVRERGRRVWGRTAVDLAVSLPRTHMEVVMSTAWSRTALLTLITVLAAAAVLAFVVFGMPAIPFAVVVIAVAVAQRSRLARAVDGSPASRNRTALVVLWLSSLVLVGTAASWFFAISRGYGFPDGVLFAYNALGLGSAAGLVASSIVLIKRRHIRRTRA